MKTIEVKNIIKCKGSGLVPIGGIYSISNDAIPDGYLLCDGAELQTKDFPELAKVLKGDQKEKFELPDLRGTVLGVPDAVWGNEDLGEIKL